MRRAVMNNFDALWAHMSSSEAVNEKIRDVIIGAGQSLMHAAPNERASTLSTARRNTRFLSTPRIAKVSPNNTN